jgi:heat shock protein HslJ
MKFRKQIMYLGIGLLVLFLAACAPGQIEVPVTGQTPSAGTPSASPGLPPKAVLDAQQWLATQLSVAVEQVQIIEVEQAEWTDSCLGLGRLNESCLQVVTPGWRVVFESDGQPYEVRTNETGSVIRLAAPQGSLGEGGALENTHWRLVSLGTPGAETPLVEGSMITLLLADGQAGGSGGCNSYGGTFEVDDGNVSFDGITRTLKACADERVTEQEQRYFQALESAESYKLEGNLLRISYDNGAGMMVFETPLPAGPAGPMPAVETPGN